MFWKFLSHRPIIVEYDFNTENAWSNDLYLNAIYSSDGRLHSFRCPNTHCGRPVKIGFAQCPFCYTRLKWKYPFKRMKI